MMDCSSDVYTDMDTCEKEIDDESDDELDYDMVSLGMNHLLTRSV